VSMPFVKMHGCGNDFIVLRESDLIAPDATLPSDPAHWRAEPAALARRICDRHFGIGADGILVYGPRPPQADVPRLRMYYWNADGSRAEMCGNGARCVIRLAHDRAETASPLVLETDAGTHAARFIPGRELGSLPSVEIDMGAPEWSGASLPQSPPGAAQRLGVGARDLDVHAVSMGNPHAIVLVADQSALAAIPLADWGRQLSEHPAFPAGANASFVAASDGALHLRVWERGAGATLACGTATCAAYAIASRAGRIGGGRIPVHVPGGSVEVWEDADGHLWLAGPAEYVARGEIAAELWSGKPAAG